MLASCTNRNLCKKNKQKTPTYLQSKNIHLYICVCNHTDGRCTNTVRGSALKVDPGRKISCCTGDSNPPQYWSWLYSRLLYQLSYPRLQFKKAVRAELCTESRLSHKLWFKQNLFIHRNHKTDKQVRETQQ